MRNNELLQTAYAILSHKAYSKREISQKLLKKGFSIDQVDEVIYYLSERGYLNDTALCDMLLRKYINCGKYGKKAIINKVRQRAISSEIIQEFITAYDFDELSQTICLIEKMLSKPGRPFNKAKIGRFLLNRGFGYSVIQQALDHFERQNKYCFDK